MYKMATHACVGTTHLKLCTLTRQWSYQLCSAYQAERTPSTLPPLPPPPSPLPPPPSPISNLPPPLLCDHGQQRGAEVFSDARVVQNVVSELNEAQVVDVDRLVLVHVHPVLGGGGEGGGERGRV